MKKNWKIILKRFIVIWLICIFIVLLFFLDCKIHYLQFFLPAFIVLIMGGIIWLFCKSSKNTKSFFNKRQSEEDKAFPNNIFSYEPKSLNFENKDRPDCIDIIEFLNNELVCDTPEWIELVTFLFAYNSKSISQYLSKDKNHYPLVIDLMNCGYLFNWLFSDSFDKLSKTELKEILTSINLNSSQDDRFTLINEILKNQNLLDIQALLINYDVKLIISPKGKSLLAKNTALVYLRIQNYDITSEDLIKAKKKLNGSEKFGDLIEEILLDRFKNREWYKLCGWNKLRFVKHFSKLC